MPFCVTVTSDGLSLFLSFEERGIQKCVFQDYFKIKSDGGRLAMQQCFMKNIERADDDSAICYKITSRFQGRTVVSKCHLTLHTLLFVICTALLSLEIGNSLRCDVIGRVWKSQTSRRLPFVNLSFLLLLRLWYLFFCRE